MNKGKKSTLRIKLIGINARNERVYGLCDNRDGSYRGGFGPLNVIAKRMVKLNAT